MLRDYETVMKAASDPNRARVLKMLEGGEMCVCQIVATLGLSQSTISKHLSLLRAAGLVDERKEGRWVHYRLAEDAVNDCALPLLSLIKDWLNRDLTVRADLERVRRIRRMPVEQLCCPNPAAVVDRELALARGKRG